MIDGITHRFSYIPDQLVKNVGTYKFHAGEYTPLDNLLNPFWLRCQSVVPRWFSPNAVTLFGGLCGLLAAVVLMCEPIGDRLGICRYVFSAVLLFLYQTADAVDGKHARLTDQCSPLGALLDHGVDAIMCFTTAMAIALTIDPSLGSLLTLGAFNAGCTGWFMAQWGDLEAHILETSGVTETEFAAMAMVALPALLGSDIYERSFYGVELRAAVCAFTMTAASGQILSTVCKVLRRTEFSATQPKSWAVLRSMFPIVWHNVAAYVLFTSPLGKAAPLLALTAIGLNACVMMTKIVFSAVTKAPWSSVGLLNANALPFMCVVVHARLNDADNEGLLLWLIVWQTVSFFLMWKSSIDKICGTLKIPFVAEVPPKQAK